MAQFSYETYEKVKLKDASFVEALKTYDLPLIRNVLNAPDCTICGRVPVSIVLDTAKHLGALSVQILSQTNSVEVIGNHIPGQWTVGYLSAAIC